MKSRDIRDRKENKTLVAQVSRKTLPKELRQNMLGALIDFLAQSGMSRSEIEESFQVCVKNQTKQSDSSRFSKSKALGVGYENLAAELLRIWHRNSRFIDEDAKPRPLSLVAGKMSLRSIIREIDTTIDANDLIRKLRSARLIRQTSGGKYLPTSEIAVVDRLSSLTIDHIAKLVIRLIATVSRNVNPSKDSLRLIERHAFAPNLLWSERSAFANFANQQGMACLESVDNWLQRRRSSPAERRRRRTVPASLHLFAYLGDQEGAVSPSKKQSASPVSKSKTKHRRTSAGPKRSNSLRAARV